MPTNFFSVDSAFPDIKNKTQEQINREMLDYLYMLLEQLRYTLSNLGINNFNDANVDEMGAIFTGGLESRVEDAEGNISTLTQTVNGFETRVSNAEGKISTLTQTVNGFETRVSDAEGNISTLTQTVNGFETRVSDAEGDISTLALTLYGFETRVSDAEGNVSTLTQTVTGFESRVSGNENSISLLAQNQYSISLRVSNNELKIDDMGVAINGKVTFENLSKAGQTVINGNNITTGSINAIDLNGCKFTSESESGKVIIIASGSITVYNGDFPVGGQYISGSNEYVIYGVGLVLEGVPYVREIAGGSKYKVLHLGNIAENAAVIRAALGI